MWMTMGQWKKVVERTGPFVSGCANIDNHGYAYVLILKAFAYHGLCRPRTSLIAGMGNEGLEDFNAALEAYQKAADYMQASQPSISYYSVQLWVHKIVYRLCMLSLRLQEPSESLFHFRRYKSMVDANLKVDFGFQERLGVYYWYWLTLSEVVRKRLYATQNGKVASDGADRQIGSDTELQNLKTELADMQAHYESVLMDVTKFPRAGSTNQRFISHAIFFLMI
jgi:hypothetical protein